MLLVLAASAGLVCWSIWGGRHPSVPEATVTAGKQDSWSNTVTTIRTRRTRNDQAIEDSYFSGREAVRDLSADAVVAELNALLDELRGGQTQP